FTCISQILSLATFWAKALWQADSKTVSISFDGGHKTSKKHVKSQSRDIVMEYAENFMTVDEISPRFGGTVWPIESE
ncbi:hypothetical protein NPIL_348651, partial [Nephila pilipes]